MKLGKPRTRCFSSLPSAYILTLSVIFTSFLTSGHALLFTKTQQTYAEFPKWNACPNSTFSFEFKTKQPKALLMYADDSGKYDYIEVMINEAKVRLRMNIVDGRDGVVEISLGTRLNDNRWHRVEIQRNRMESKLLVDEFVGNSVAFGSDFQFGDINSNSPVFFGGIPNKQKNMMSLPSSYYEPRFEGEIRNVIYWNCTCLPIRGHMIEGSGVTANQNDMCGTRNTCPENCLCIDRDEGPGCQCRGFKCQTETDTRYYLPMDRISGYTLDNPSGLDAKVIGNPERVKGVVGNALRIDCQTSKIKVSGPGHRQECFGDLDLCPKGYTIGFWVKFDKPEPGSAVYLSNGGQTTESHGVAMTYQVGKLQWVFRKKTGQEWHVSANNILPRHWYHVLVTWVTGNGLTLYINGNKLSSEEVPSVRAATSASGNKYDDFIIGQSNDGKGISDLGIMTIDDFRFWSFEMSEKELREMGPIYRYHLSMDQLELGKLVVPNLEPRTRGLLRQIPGKIGNAVFIPGKGQYIDLGSFHETCVGNTSRCMYGFMVSFWIKFYQMANATYNYYMASGVGGFTIFSYANRLHTTVQMNDRQWKTFTSGMQNGRWYFIEVSWSEKSGLSLYIDQDLKAIQSASTHKVVTQSTRHDDFYIARDNSNRYTGRSAFAIDDVEIFNADREKLLAIDFIQRGKPDKRYYSFDTMVDSEIIESTTRIQTYGRPALVPGKIGQALMLSGTIQVAQFDHGDGCLGNLDFCTHGVLLSLWFRPTDFKEGMYYLSSGLNGITFSYVDRKFRVSAMTTPLKWEVVTSELETRQWYFLEASWGPNSGLQLYVNGRLVVEDRYPRENIEEQDMTKLLYDKFVFGKENSGKAGSLYGAATYDEMEFWYGTRDYLLANNYIQRGRPVHYRIKMDSITVDGKSLAHASLPVRLYGRPSLVPGKINKAIQLSGGTQFIDLGTSKETCLGNIKLCHFGKYISMWVKIDEYDYNMYIMSTGRNGIRIYHIAGYIYVTVDSGNKSWRLTVPRMSEKVWHFVELSWHPDFGLELLVDGEKTEVKDFRTIPVSENYPGNFYIGGPNFGDTSGQRFSYAKMAIDDVEIWYGRREELLAFDYIIGDKVEYESFSMETATGSVIFHPRYRITLERGAQLVPGRVGKAVSLSGRGQYVDFGQHADKCLGNLDLCNHGITLAMLLKPKDLKGKTYFLTSPTYSLYYEDRQLKSKFMSGGKEWNVSSQYFRVNDWNSVMLSWEPSDGLQLLVNDTLVASDVTPVDVMQGDQPQDGSIYFGKSSQQRDEAAPNVELDEIQIWYANLEKLRSRGLLKGPVHETLPFYQMTKDGVLKLPSRTITMHGGVKIVAGEHRNAILLDGKKQYIDLGENLTCSGNLDNCPYGFTMRFSTKPTKLQKNMYFLDSYPITIFYRDGKLYTTVRTSSKTWTVAAPGFKAGEWQVVDVSWHPEVGLTLHVNEEESGAQKTYGTDQMPVFDYDRKTYFGRALTKMVDERYAATTLENFEIWNVRRDVLIADEQIVEQTTEGTTRMPIRPTLPPRTRAPIPPTLPPPIPRSTDRSVSNDDSGITKGYGLMYSGDRLMG